MRKRKICSICGITHFSVGNRQTARCPGCSGSFTKEELISTLKELSKNHKILKKKHIPNSVSWACYRYFNSFDKAKKEAGLKIYSPNGVMHPKTHKKLPKGAKKLTKKVSYILGVGYGDGTLIYRKRDGNIVGGAFKFSTIDREFYEKVKKYLMDWSGFELSESFKRKKGKNNQYSFDMNSYQAVKFLKSINFSDILSSNEEIQKAFVKGIVDSEGNVGGGGVRIGNTNLELLNLIKKLLENIGISSYIHKEYDEHPIYKNTKTYYMLYISGKENVEKFRDEINFIIKRKRKSIDSFLENNSRWTKKEVIKELRKISNELNHSPSAEEAGGALSKVCSRKFGTFNNAKEKAGLKIYPIGVNRTK